MNLFRETRRNRRTVGGAVVLAASFAGCVAVAIILTQRGAFAAIVGGVMLTGAIIQFAAGIVLWSTAGRLPD